MTRTTSITLLGLALIATAGRPKPTDDSSTDDSAITDDTSHPHGIDWQLEPIATHSGGLQSRLALGPSGLVGVAYFGNEPWQDGTCDEVPVSPPPKMRYDLYYAERVASTWTTELLTSPVVAFTPTGVDLRYDDTGQAHIAFNGGEPEMQFCGANDAILAVKGATDWNYETAADNSGESNTGEPASDSGFVVGLWPALAFDTTGNPAILHRDTHFGSMQHDDQYRSDAEFAWRTGGWDHEAADIGDGGGEYNELLFDAEDRPIALHAITVVGTPTSRHGVWAVRRETDGTWAPVQLHEGAIGTEISAALDPVSGDLVVAFYSAVDRAVRVRRLADPTQFTEASAWTSELVGKAQYDEGQYVSIAFTSSGDLAMAYHRCKLITSSSGGCDQNDEAVLFARYTDGAWDYDVVVESAGGSCGEYTSLAIDANDVAWIAYRCTELDGSDHVFRPRLAWGQLQ